MRPVERKYWCSTVMLVFGSVAAAASAEMVTQENESLRVAVDKTSGCFTVTDKTTEQVWRPDPWDGAAGVSGLALLPLAAGAGDERPQTWPVQAVQPGHGWRGNAGVVIDGNASSTLSSRAYAELPLLLTFDLGQARPIGQVRVSGWEEGRHNYLFQLDVEVSLDGQEWFRWARVARRATGGMLERRSTRYVARSAAVSARYVRLRVRSVRGQAHFTAVEIIPADTATPPALYFDARTATLEYGPPRRASQLGRRVEGLLHHGCPVHGRHAAVPD